MVTEQTTDPTERLMKARLQPQPSPLALFGTAGADPPYGAVPAWMRVMHSAPIAPPPPADHQGEDALATLSASVVDLQRRVTALEQQAGPPPPPPAQYPLKPEYVGASGQPTAAPSSNRLLALVSGANMPPALVGFVRAVLTAAAVAGIEKAITLSGTLHLSPDQAALLPILVLLLRTAEGSLDQVKGAPQ